jgi:dihydroorotate dehydrogenase electron transfer subunit
MNRYQARIISNELLWPDSTRPAGRQIRESRIMWLRCPEIAKMARPGQFVMVPSGPRGFLPRPFSIHNVNGDDIAFFYSVWTDGAGTPWLATRNAKDDLLLAGPQGNGFHLLSQTKGLLLIAGGIGIAPLAFLARHAVNQGFNVTILMGAGTANQLYPAKLLPGETRLFLFTDDGSQGEKGTVLDNLSRHLPETEAVFACGPLPMYREMARLGAAWPVLKKAQVSLETRMACGHGLCYGCTVQTENGLRQVCHDGPVFPLDNIIWDSISL